MASIYHAFDAPFAPVESKVETVRSATKCCFAFDLLVGTKLILVYYFLRGILDVVFPLVMHYEFRSREAGGSANGAGFQHHTCKWTGGACPNFAQGEVGRQQMRNTLRSELACNSNCIGASNCGQWAVVEATPSAGDSGTMDMELFFSFRATTVLIAAVAAAVTLKKMQDGSNEYLKPFVRALLALVAAEIIGNIFVFMMISERCNDVALRSEFAQTTHCMPGAADTYNGHPMPSAMLNPDSTPLQCEEQMALKTPLGIWTFLLGLTINSYFIWIVSSYEKSTRDQAASAGGTGLEEKL